MYKVYAMQIVVLATLAVIANAALAATINVNTTTDEFGGGAIDLPSGY